MAGGELSPSLYPRTDAAKYSFGLRTMRNFWVRRDGGSDNRPGTKFVNRNRTHSSYSRLIPFSISGTEGYAVHFEEGHFRVLYRGKPLTVAVNANANNIIGISVAAQVVVSVANTNGVWENGVECYIEGVHGMPEINGKIYLVSDVDDATDTFKLKDLDGNYVNSSTYGAWISGGTVKHVAHGTHDYLSAELATIQFVQRKKHLESYVDTTTLGSIASLIMTHPNHPVQELQVGSYYESTGLGFAYSPSDYELTYNLVQNVISASLNAPTGGSYTYRYCLTAILENGEETTPIIVSSGAGSNWAISGISKANPAVVTVSNTTGLVSGDLIYITDVEGMTEVNGKYYTLTLIGGTTFSINADSTNWTTYTSAGNVYRSSLVDTSSAIPTVSAPNVISSLTYPTLNDLRVTGYNVYLNSYGVYGYLGTTSISIFNDTGLELDPSITPPEVFAFHAHSPELNPLSDSYSNFPSAVAMVQQRLCFGNFVDDPEQVAVSQSGRYSTFSKSFPGVESDGFIFKPVSKARNIIKHILDVGGMLVFTGTGEFSVSGVNGILSPSELVVKQHSGFGSSELSPILIDGTAKHIKAEI
jgi:hypothetical protein